MDKKQLIKDIFTLNWKTFGTRFYKLIAVLQRKFNLGKDNFSTTKNIQDLPIIINNCNRLTYLKQLIDFLKAAGCKNIVVLDNKSDYAPLLEFYKTTDVKVILLDQNYGHLAFWKSGVYKQYYTDYYVYTDPDVLPVNECPENFLEHFMKILNTYTNIEKVGFGLKIDDIPGYYDKKEEVINWEKKFWLREIDKDLYDAPLDTTFALYKPFTRGDIWVQNALRTGGKYVLRHLPWYENSSNNTEENLYYQNKIKQGASHWIEKSNLL